MTLLLIWICLLIIVSPILLALCKAAAEADRQAEADLRMLEKRKQEYEEHGA